MDPYTRSFVAQSRMADRLAEAQRARIVKVDPADDARVGRGHGVASTFAPTLARILTIRLRLAARRPSLLAPASR